MNVNYGLIAVNNKGEILHFCGYEYPPSTADMHHLKNELNNDPDFKLTEQFILLEASPKIVSVYKEMIK